MSYTQSEIPSIGGAEVQFVKGRSMLIVVIMGFVEYVERRSNFECEAVLLEWLSRLHLLHVFVVEEFL